MADSRQSRGFTPVEIIIVVLILGVLLSVAMPNFMRARVNSRLQIAISNLNEIDLAKQQFAKANKLVAGAAVNDGTDLAPNYLKRWPSGPITGLVYTAQAVGTEPTLNSLNSAQLQSACSGSNPTPQCPF